jgi:transglutaminase-like putative cysteine protease
MRKSCHTWRFSRSFFLAISSDHVGAVWRNSGPKTMSLLTATCEIDFDAQTPIPAILMLRPRSGPAQWICHEEYSITPRVPVIEYTDIFGNLCQRVVIPPGKTKVRAECTADTADAVDVDFNAAFIEPQNLPENIIHFTLASRYCPSDQLGALAREIVAGASVGYGQVEAIRAWVHANIEYRYGTSTPATTAWDTSQSRQGVCRDFAHLGIALCRALSIPARMVVGYTPKLAVPDIHAWFEAFVGGRWFVFDATHEHTSGNRIAIAYGRDATDVAFVTQFGPLTLERLTVTVQPASSTS